MKIRYSCNNCGSITYTKADDIIENEEKIFIRKNRECSEIIEVQR